jgi:hypothetical protein
MNVWILSTYGDPDPKAYATESLGLKYYYEYIEERTSGMPHDSDEFEWGEDDRGGLKQYYCYCYGEFVSRLNELKVHGG